MTKPANDIPAADRETELVELFNGRLRLYQQKEGYRFSIDAVILGRFAAERATGAVADLGTGSGILPVILAKTGNLSGIVGIEIQAELAALARQNVDYNRLGEKVSIVHTDIKHIRNHFAAECFDTVITNPPFYREGSGRINPDNQNAVARHELFGTLHDFITGAAYLLKQTGKLFAVYLPGRLVDLIAEMRLKNIEPKTLRFVHSSLDGPAVMVLVEGVKGAGVEAKILQPLILYDENGEYTDEVQEIFKRI